jgi:hypothetical protein
LSHVRGVWTEGAFARLSDAVEYKFALLPGFLREPLVRSYYVLGWLDCGLWGPAVNPVDCLRALHVPIYFCHGMRDELVPFAEGQMLYESYAGPKECWWVEGASHYNVRQRHAEEYVRRLRGFLKRCLAGSEGPRLSIHEPAARLRDRAAQFPGRFEPLRDYDFCVSYRLSVGGAVCRASGQLRHFGDESLVFLAPVQDHFIAWAIHLSPPHALAHQGPFLALPLGAQNRPLVLLPVPARLAGS